MNWFEASKAGKVAIHLDHAQTISFNPGDKVTGVVHIANSSDFKASQVAIMLIGYERVGCKIESTFYDDK